jgi:hypothetical protein
MHLQSVQACSAFRKAVENVHHNVQVVNEPIRFVQHKELDLKQ